MNCFCEDCNIGARSYEDWIIHLTTSAHQDTSASPKIEQWVEEQNPRCIILASLFEKKNPFEIATKFSKFGFLWNFYAHHDHKFFILQYDGKHTADFALSKVAPETSWKLHVRRLREMDTVDWAALFPEEDPESVQQVQQRRDQDLGPPPLKMRRQDVHANDSGFNSGPPPIQPLLQWQTRADAEANRRADNFYDDDYYDPFESDLVELPARNQNPPPLMQVQTQRPEFNRRNNATASTSSTSVQRHVTSFVNDIQSIELPPTTLKVPFITSTPASGPFVNTSTVQQKKQPSPVNQINQVSKSMPVQQVNGTATATSSKQPAATTTTTTATKPSTATPADPEKLSTKQSMEQLMSSTADGCIDEQLDQFLKCTAINLKELEKLNNTVVRDLSEILKKKFQQAEPCLFDSFQGGIGNPICTLEINVGGLETEEDLGPTHLFHSSSRKAKEEDAKYVKLITEIARLLDDERKADVSSVAAKSFGGIRMKINGQGSRVYFLHKISARHDFQISLCCGKSMNTRKQNLMLIQLYTKLDPTVRSLLCLVFYWASYHKFITVDGQLIKDYILALLVVVFLSKKGVVPTLEKLQIICQNVINVSEPDWLQKLCNNDQLTQAAAILAQEHFNPAQIFILDLAKEFFEMYGDEELRNQVICSWTSDFLPRETFRQPLEELPPQLGQYKLRVEARQKEMGASHPSAGTLNLSTSVLVIQNPFDLTFNLCTVQLKILKRFQEACRRTAKLVQDLLDLDGEGKPCTLLSIFSPIAAEETPARQPPAAAGPAAPATSTSTRTLTHVPTITTTTGNSCPTGGDEVCAPASCEKLFARMHAKMTALNLREFPQHTAADEVKQYCVFEITRSFRECFKKHMTRLAAYEKDDLPLRNAHLCSLWFTFALEFIRSIWYKCFYMDSAEHVWHQEQEARSPTSPHLGAFPPGIYVRYYSTFECKGWASLQPEVRLSHHDSISVSTAATSSAQSTTTSHAKHQLPFPIHSKIKSKPVPVQRIPVPVRVNPFEQEALVTQKSFCEIQHRKRAGKPYWTFNCTVGYEDRDSRHEAPRLAVIVSGRKEDAKSIEYMVTAIKRMFGDYQLHLLEVWLNKV